jgi:DNA polymerase
VSSTRKLGDPVPGVGPDYTPYAIVGEAPGEEEDIQGRPFVGASGNMINEALDMLRIDRDSIYITNVVKTRPPGNATPSYDDIERARPALGAELLERGVTQILAVGKVSRDALLPWLSKESMKLSRECSYSYNDTDIRVYVTWHPSYVIRNGKQGDVLMQFLDDIRHWYAGA